MFLYTGHVLISLHGPFYTVFLPPGGESCTPVDGQWSVSASRRFATGKRFYQYWLSPQRSYTRTVTFHPPRRSLLPVINCNNHSIIATAIIATVITTTVIHHDGHPRDGCRDPRNSPPPQRSSTKAVIYRYCHHHNGHWEG